MRGQILYFLLLELAIPLDLGSDISYKRGGFPETLLEKSFEFVPNRRDGIVAFNLRFVLLSTEINLVFEKQSRKEDAFMAHGSSCVKIILTLLTEIIVFHIQARIVKVGIPRLEGSIPEGEVCLVMFLALDKQF